MTPEERVDLLLRRPQPKMPTWREVLVAEIREATAEEWKRAEKAESHAAVLAGALETLLLVSDFPFNNRGEQWTMAENEIHEFNDAVYRARSALAAYRGRQG